MHELAKTYNPADVEDKWYSYWMEHDLFKSVPDEREPYTIVIPPPNVTGILHMGHMLNNTIQDILIRRAAHRRQKRSLGARALTMPQSPLKPRSWLNLLPRESKKATCLARNF